MIIFIFFLICAAECQEEISNCKSLTVRDIQKLRRGQLRLSVELFKAAAVRNRNKNVFFSPSSVYNGLLLLYFASSCSTEIIFENLLHLRTSSKRAKTNIMKNYFRSKYNINKTTSGTYGIVLVNRVYVSPDLRMKRCAKRRFCKDISVFNTERTCDVNTWVSKQTKGYIKNFFNEGSLSQDDKLVSVNAAYFRGNWENPFQETSTRPFFLTNATKLRTGFISALNEYQSFTDQNINAQILSLPYKGDKMSMIIILPTLKPHRNRSPSISGVVKKLSAKRIRRMIQELYSQSFCETQLFIPRFSSEEENEFIPILEDIVDESSSEALFSDQVNLTDLFMPYQQVTVSHIVQKTKFNVYETGTEPGRAGDIQVPLPFPQCSKTFQADHPFIYLLYDRSDRIIHFMGIYNEPKPKV